MTEKMSEKMGDLLKFVDLLAKQTCRRAAYEYEMGFKNNKENKSSIYSQDFLKKMHEKPRENIYKLVKNPQKTLKGARVGNSFNMQQKDNKFTKFEQNLLLDFVNNINSQAPPRHLQWLDLQHYLQYVYRNFACSNPDPSAEVLSTFFVSEMKELVDSLKKADESQLWLRVFALLREYCIFAQWHYSKNDQEHALLKFFCYYEAMLTAAKNLVLVFADFESKVIYKNYRVCWIDFNTFIFIRFFYESERVKTRLAECIKTKKSPGDAPQMFALLDDLKKLWTKEQTRVLLIHQEANLLEPSPEFAKEKKVLAAHKKVLSANFWVDRDKKEIEKLDLNRLDHNLFDLLKDRTFFPEGPGLNKNGQCICEECLIAKYKCFLEDDSGQDFRVIQSTDRVTFCRRCKNLVDLDFFHKHINSHAVIDLDNSKSLLSNRTTNLTRIISEKMDFVKLSNNSTNLADLLNEKLKISDNSGPLSSKSKTTATVFERHPSKTTDMESSKAAFEEFLKQKKDSPHKNDQTLSNNVRNFIKIKKDIFNQSNGTFDGKGDSFLNQTAASKSSIKVKEMEEIQARMREIRRNGHKPYSTERNKPNEAAENCANCSQENGDQSKLSEEKKCDCTYCEVFSKINDELKNKFRVRMQQRREKRSKENKPILNGNLNNPKLKNIINKVEALVPLPSSSTDVNSTPSVTSTESLVGNVDFMDDIYGLVNYIEGNTILNKIELAQKKAAKKARQKARREQEKIQAEEEAKIKLEEQKRKEEEKKLEKERKLEEQKRLEAAEKKKKKKLRQQAKKIAEGKQVVEETIPAMVTIKRVPSDDSESPSVTITLKGYTPDQDKLLFTLVDEKKVSENVKEESENIKDKKKSKRLTAQKEAPQLISKKVKVTLAVDKATPAFVNPPPEACHGQNKDKSSDKKSKLKDNKSRPKTGELTSIGNLRLPPGITITKVEGPVANRTYIGAEPTKGTTVVGKSGVIVVDTEKLMHKTPETNNTQEKTTKSKKNRKRKNKKAPETVVEVEKPKMVTLKNPIFQQYKNSKQQVMDNSDACAPAAIFSSENGMVTIRSSRLQQSLNNGTAPNSVPLPLMPNLLSEMPNKILTNPNTYYPVTPPEPEIKKDPEYVTSLNAQEILSGLPGIEITKVDKKMTKHTAIEENLCQDAEISIIPSTTANDLEFDEDDWLYDSVFKPRDVLEDDMDPDELELEAFKRFCQQSVPPKQKEKVAYLNVADIVLKKKTDVKFA